MRSSAKVNASGRMKIAKIIFRERGPAEPTRWTKRKRTRSPARRERHGAS